MTRVVSRNQTKGIEKEPTLIVGAGDGGALLMRQMREKNSMNLEPVVAVDDDEKKTRHVHSWCKSRRNNRRYRDARYEV